ncbi:uncharacterized protein LOC110976797 [Acanthaster planci]|uniref:Uncharacterized protein LOC110976797 n=1 Tax=Acanthaster planci TaxID=133434 RepID=A0A8B7XYU7_ACAPL|nr:uncharacterized protein LOC110976797 [Acanthaster planci]XP_022086077.1 uncharacterized protein LOC110976797 [Acanthaster planci]XP_022086078.1 uncharacterized protein LOC110976797 [Acanthaster planci]XP_022086079.1 uncharacterized protein LOC110976797 [Acanthaster planci]XP_022086080.1 uncharacterized protein LOC110976797 [Acanthaster planci]XP_022086081.1 uncharacterized protein LOC110976797 [Acanthaster planci]
MAAEIGQIVMYEVCDFIKKILEKTPTSVSNNADEGTPVDYEEQQSNTTIGHPLEEKTGHGICAHSSSQAWNSSNENKMWGRDGVENYKDTDCFFRPSSQHCLFCLRELVMHSGTLSVRVEETVRYETAKVLGRYNVQKPIPTLAQLCLQRLVNFETTEEMIQLPPGLLPEVKETRHQRWLQQVRFDWLLKALVQAERTVDGYLWFGQQYDRAGLRQCFRRDTRHIDGAIMSSQHCPGLPLMPGMLPLPDPVDGYDASDWCIAVLAHAISMLLPSSVPGTSSLKALHHRPSETIWAYVHKVESLLKQWAPSAVHHCFDVALAYVWWTRGYLERAEQALTKSIGKGTLNGELTTTCISSLDTRLQYGLHLNELGRLMAQSGESELAAKYYRDAAKLISDESTDHINEIKLHSLILCASAYDQGIMNQTSAWHAATSWDAVLCEQHCPSDATRAALISMLHCHTLDAINQSLHDDLSEVDRNKEWLLKMESNIVVVAEKDPNAYFHLSVVRSLLGKFEDAERAFVSFSRYFGSRQGVEVPGFIACCSASPKSNLYPWWPFTQWISEAGAVCTCIPLLWRRVLGYPIGLGDSGSHGCLSEVCGDSPNLRITKDGFLTGTIMVNLPPMTCVLLDPYTGSVCVPDETRHIELQRWDNFHKTRDGGQQSLRAVQAGSEPSFELDNDGCRDVPYACGFRLDTFLPTPIHLLTSECTGAVCSLLISNNVVNYERKALRQEDWEFWERLPEISHHLAMLQYSKGSRHVRVDLLRVILRARRDAVLEDLRRDTWLIENPSRLEDAKDLLDILIDKRCEINLPLIIDILQGKQLPVWGNVKNASHFITKQMAKDCLPPPQTVRLSNVLHVGESTVILSLLCALKSHSSQRDNALVFLDCRTEETFKNPVVHLTKTVQSFWILPEQIETWRAPRSTRLFFFAYERLMLGNRASSENELVVFDQRGVILLRATDTDVLGFSGCRTFVTCSGWNLLGCDESMTHVISLDVRTKECKKSNLSLIQSIQLAADTVFVALPSGIVALDPASLEPLAIPNSPPNTPTNDSRLINPESRGMVIEGDCRFMSVLATLEQKEQEGFITTVILGYVNSVSIIQVIRRAPGRSSHGANCERASVEVSASITLPGIPTEACYISKSVGFVVTATVSKERHKSETEILYWFDMSGRFRGIHPMLGPGRHGMISVQMEDPEVSVEASHDVSEGRPLRWHLYFADGFGGVCCMIF